MSVHANGSKAWWIEYHQKKIAALLVERAQCHDVDQRAALWERIEQHRRTMEQTKLYAGEDEPKN